MKGLSDYTGEEAIDLWADLLEPIADIYSDNEVKEAFKECDTMLKKAHVILKLKKEDAAKIIERVDPTPITGMNLPVRFIKLLLEIEHSEEFGGFFGLSRQEENQSTSSGSVMENTEEEGK